MNTLANPRVRAARRAHMVRRLLTLHAECVPSDLEAGVAWYDRARHAAEEIAGNTVCVQDAAAIIAHLSPRNPWAKNLSDAAAVIEAASLGLSCPSVHTTSQRRKAWRVATGEASPFNDHGPKTGAFLANILGDEQRVCVDVWAARAAEGRDCPHAPSGARYALIEEAYVHVAGLIGMSPRNLQAAIWVHVRGSAD